jgi:hypothetical protein
MATPSDIPNSKISKDQVMNVQPHLNGEISSTIESPSFENDGRRLPIIQHQSPKVATAGVESHKFIPVCTAAISHLASPQRNPHSVASEEMVAALLDKMSLCPF